MSTPKNLKPDGATRRSRKLTEQRLIDAGLEVFALHGFSRTPVSAVAEKANANVALINRYFGSKDGLLLAIVEKIVAEKQSGELPYPPAKTLEDELSQYLIFRYTQDRTNKHISRLIIAEMATDDMFRQKALATLTYGEDANLRGRLKALQRAGRIDQRANLTNLFRMVSLFSFSAGFVEGELLAVPPKKTRALISEFASTIGAQFGR